jgi:hypothetical protein
LQTSTIVVIAGYKGEMQDMMQMNPGFTGRFGSTLLFQDWSNEDLSTLVISQLAKGPPPDLPYALDDTAGIKKFLEDAFHKLRAHNPKAFSNARDADEMRKLVKMQYSSRCGSKVPFPPVAGATPCPSVL